MREADPGILLRPPLRTGVRLRCRDRGAAGEDGWSSERGSGRLTPTPSPSLDAPLYLLTRSECRVFLSDEYGVWLGSDMFAVLRDLSARALTTEHLDKTSFDVGQKKNVGFLLLSLGRLSVER